LFVEKKKQKTKLLNEYVSLSYFFGCLIYLCIHWKTISRKFNRE